MVVYDFHQLRGCVGTCSQTLLHKLQYGVALQKLKLGEHSLGALITLPFVLEQGTWSSNRLAKKYETKLKNMKRSSPKQTLEMSHTIHRILVHLRNQWRSYIVSCGRTKIKKPLTRSIFHHGIGSITHTYKATAPSSNMF